VFTKYMSTFYMIFRIKTMTFLKIINRLVLLMETLIFLWSILVN
jgi:hypothetical protein